MDCRAHGWINFQRTIGRRTIRSGTATDELRRHRQRGSKMFWKQSRREMFRLGPMIGAMFQSFAQKATAAPLELSSKLYESIGVRPVINSRGTFTIITGSQTLPEVKKAMEEASRHFVNMDELMDGVGRRLAELSGAEWGIVTNG